MSSQDELTASICGAVQQLTQIKKADFLLNVALALIEEGKYGEEVENYLDVYLKTPGLPKEDIARALLARGSAQRERVFAKAQQDFLAVLRRDPLNIDAQSQLRGKETDFGTDPCQRAPPEIWELIAAHTPRYHLRTWLFVSPFHRDIAARRIFHTVDIYFEPDEDRFNRGVGIFDRAKNDPVFASRVKLLRLHLNFEEGIMSDLIIRVVKTSLPAFKALRNFEWIGSLDMDADMVQVLLDTHRNLHELGIIAWEFTAFGVSAFDKLHKFTLRIGTHEETDVGEIRTLLDRNERTLKHLTLGTRPGVQGPSWDSAFDSATINNLTHLDLVNMGLSDFVLTRIALAHNLQSLTLIGSLVDPNLTLVVFANDRIVDGTHTSLPLLEAFRFDMVDQGDDDDMYHSVTRFLQKREKLRRLDLGRCPWEMVQGILPDLKNLRVLSARIKNLSQETMKSLVESIPTQMVAIQLSVLVSDPFLDDHARYFTRFNMLSFLHIQSCLYRPRTYYTEEDFQALKHRSACSIMAIIPWLDFLVLHGELYVVTEWLKQLSVKSLEYGSGGDVGSEDAAWLERKDVPFNF